MDGLHACAPLHSCTSSDDRHVGHGVSREESLSASEDLEHSDVPYTYIVHTITLLGAEQCLDLLGILR